MIGNLRPGEIAALLEAFPDGWIHPPVTDTLNPQPRSWLSADLYRLNDRGLVRERRRWLDGLYSYRLTDEGRAVKREMLRKKILPDSKSTWSVSGGRLLATGGTVSAAEVPRLFG